MRNGEEKSYSETGQLISISRFENDQLNGLSQSWNKKGILVFEGEYKDNLRQGKFNKFYEDGKPYLEQFYVADQLHGLKKKYDPDGHVTVSNYESGQLVQEMR